MVAATSPTLPIPKIVSITKSGVVDETDNAGWIAYDPVHASNGNIFLLQLGYQCCEPKTDSTERCGKGATLRGTIPFGGSEPLKNPLPFPETTPLASDRIADINPIMLIRANSNETLDLMSHKYTGVPSNSDGTVAKSWIENMMMATGGVVEGFDYTGWYNLGYGSSVSFPNFNASESHPETQTYVYDFPLGEVGTKNYALRLSMHLSGLKYPLHNIPLPTSQTQNPICIAR